MNKLPKALNPRTLAMRAASTVIRISDKAECKKLVAEYERILGYPAIRLDAPPDQGSDSKEYYSFPTSASRGPGKDTELLIIRQDHPHTNCTITYYEVHGHTEEELRAVHDKFVGAGYRQLESPRPDLKYPHHDKPTTFRSLLVDESASNGPVTAMIGLTINPPWPR